MPGGRRAGTEVLRKGTKQALGPARELYLGRYEEALDVRKLSLSSESSHPSELEIFEVKQYGPGEMYQRTTVQASFDADRALEHCRFSGYAVTGQGIGEFVHFVKKRSND